MEKVPALFAADIRRQRVNAMRGFRHWKWHLDEVYVKINGETLTCGVPSITREKSPRVAS